MRPKSYQLLPAHDGLPPASEQAISTSTEAAKRLPLSSRNRRPMPIGLDTTVWDDQRSQLTTAAARRRRDDDAEIWASPIESAAPRPEQTRQALRSRRSPALGTSTLAWPSSVTRALPAFRHLACR